MKESVNIYLSTCCQIPATKPACVKPKAQPKQKKAVSVSDTGLDET